MNGRRTKRLVGLGSAALAVGLFAADASAVSGWNSATYRRNPFSTISNLAEAEAAIGSGILLGSGITASVNDREVDGGGSGGNFYGDVEPFGMVAGDDNDFAVLHTGFLNITQSGNYTFTTNTDDGSRLRLDLNQDGVFGVGETIIADDVLSNPHDAHSELLALARGVYRIEHTWFDRVGGGEGELGLRLDIVPGLHLIGDKNQIGFQYFGAFVVTLFIAGDYNANGIVDAADYVVWRDNLNSSATLNGDTTPGGVTAADYQVWQANFGRTSGSGAGASAVVPEPNTVGLAFLDLLGLIPLRRTRATAGAIPLTVL